MHALLHALTFRNIAAGENYYQKPSYVSSIIDMNIVPCEWHFSAL